MKYLPSVEFWFLLLLRFEKRHPGLFSFQIVTTTKTKKCCILFLVTGWCNETNNCSMQFLNFQTCFHIFRKYCTRRKRRWPIAGFSHSLTPIPYSDWSNCSFSFQFCICISSNFDCRGSDFLRNSRDQKPDRFFNFWKRTKKEKKTAKISKKRQEIR